MIDRSGLDCNSNIWQGTGRPKEPYSFVATGSRDKTIKLWDAASGQLLREFVGT
jgi:WD40 repeat protein